MTPAPQEKENVEKAAAHTVPFWSKEQDRTISLSELHGYLARLCYGVLQ